MMWKNSLDGRYNRTIMERAQTESTTDLPPSNSMMDYLFSFIFFLQVRTRQIRKVNSG